MELKGVFGNWKLLLAMLLTMVLLFVPACTEGGKVEKTTIRLADTPWSCTPPLNLRAKIILEEMGYEVDLVSVNMDMAWTGVAAGEIDAIMDAWVLNYPEKLIGLGDKVSIIGLNYGGAVQGWFVPEAYTPPELTSLGQLNDYIELFDKDGDGRGEVLGSETGSGAARMNNLMIDRLDLNYDQMEIGEWAKLSQVEASIERGETVLFYNWTPHWIFGKYDLRLLEDPSESIPENLIMTVVNKELLKTNPDVCWFLNRFETTVEEVNQMIYEAEAEVEGREPIDIAREWVDNNRDEVNDWLKAE